MFNAQIEEVLAAVSKVKTPRKEDCLKKLVSFSRFVTPCPDIFDEASKKDNTHAKPPAYSTERPDEDCTCEDCDESSECSDESSWESVKHQTSGAEGQWKNLLEYEESLLQNKKKQPTRKEHQARPQQLSQSLKPSQSCAQPVVESDSVTSGEDVVKTLNSIVKSLKKLETERYERVEDKFGKYVAQKLHQMSLKNRVAAEIEINKVLMKYLGKQLQDVSPLDDSFSEDSDRNV